MNFLIVRRRERGVAIPSAQVSRTEPVKGEISIYECHSEVMNRMLTVATIFNPGPGPDLLPRLIDAKVTGMSTRGMNINGIEEVEGVLYAQSWWCRCE